MATKKTEPVKKKIQATDFSRRFTEFYQYAKLSRKLSQTDLANEIGAKQQYIGHYLSGRNKPKDFDGIKKAFPELNIDWLKNGKGEMLTKVKDMDIIKLENKLKKALKEVEDFKTENKVLREQYNEIIKLVAPSIKK